MNANLTNPGMNIEDYEDQAVKKSKLAKGIGIAVGGAVGGAAIAGGTAYAAINNEEDHVLNEAMSAEEMIAGAGVGEEIQPTPEPAPQPTTQYVYVEQPTPEPEPEPEVTWDETTNYYIGDEKVMSVEEGTVEGHDFMLVDADADGHADIFALDVNGNHVYEEDEIVALTPQDNVHMGHETANTTNDHYAMLDPWGDGNEHNIHNNFEDEKTGEEYHGDYAENNPDYNPHADVDYGNGQYLAEDYGYDNDNHTAELNEDEFASDSDLQFDMAHSDSYEESIEENVDVQYDLADAESGDDSFDSMMDSEEFLG